MKKRLIVALCASTSLASVGLAAPAAFAAGDIPVAADGIGGVVTSAKGPEAGVWVIAETTDTPNRFIKEVVTDDQGRYYLPELPKAKYKVWVRGYGLVDSKQVDAKPGKSLNLKAVVAPDAAAAAQYYPANYWYAMIQPPAASEFPGTGVGGNGIPVTMKSQQQWVANLREGCGHCHQVGDKPTRELANNSVEGWAERIKMARDPGDQAIGNHAAQQAAGMQNVFAGLGHDRTVKMMADWTARIGKGEVPAEAPPRPMGVERNVVITIRDWANGRFVHDTVSTDRRNPTMNGYGPVWASGVFSGTLENLNPKTNVNEEIAYSFTTDEAGVYSGATTAKHDIMLQPHNAMLDQKGRVWSSEMGRGQEAPLKYPQFCTDAGGDSFAKYYPKPGQSGSVGLVYDPATKKLEGVPLCYGVHHLMFGRDSDNTLFFTGPGSDVVGWVDTRVWDESHDAKKSVGWCPMVLDTKEKGVTKAALSSDEGMITPDRTQWNQPGQPADPKKDTQITGGQYGVDVNPVDGSIWFAQQTQPYPSRIIRFEKGAHPPETCKTEVYQPPKLPNGEYAAFGGRGVSIDSKGIAWVMFANGKMGRFDRGKCAVLNGPAATGQQCPEGWKFYDFPGPKLSGSKDNQADWNYLTWVDQYDTLGLGKDVPITPGTWSDSMIALMPDTGEVVRMRVPYPMGAYARGVDGRIDDPKAGWKGRGLWTTYAMVPVWHQEGGLDGAGPELVHFQIRPDPLAH